MEAVFLTFITDEMITTTIRLFLIVLLSGLIGIEREIKNHPAGLRTHILVGVGSCLLMLVSLFGFEPYIQENQEVIRFDPARIPSYIISGIGFLGAGTILVHRGITVKGLTTAASIWVVAGLGIVVGVGMYFEAILTTLIIIITLIFLNKLEARYKRRSIEALVTLSIIIEHKAGALNEINKRLSKERVSIIEFAVEDYEHDQRSLMQYSILLLSTDINSQINILDSLKELPFVHKINIQKKEESS